MNGAQWTPSHMLTLLLSLLFFSTSSPHLNLLFSQLVLFACNFYEWFHWNGLCLRLFSKRFVSESFFLRKLIVRICRWHAEKGKESQVWTSIHTYTCFTDETERPRSATVLLSPAQERWKSKPFQMQGATGNILMKWFHLSRRSISVCLFFLRFVQT